MFGIMVALPAEASGIVTQRLRVGDTYRLTDHATLIVTGMGASALPVIRRTIAKGNFSTLVSLGTAVGLTAKMTAGTLCIPDEVVCADQILYCQSSLQQAFIKTLSTEHRIEQQRLTHTPVVLSDLQEKQALHQQTAAVVADMESFLIGQEAMRQDLQFLAIRVVVDSLDLHLPPAILPACVPSLVVTKLVWALCRQPKLLEPLLTLAHHFHQAKKTLRRVAKLELFNRGCYDI